MASELALRREDEGTEVEARRPSAGPTRLMWRALWRRKIARLALVYILFFYAVGFFAPLLAPHGYADQNLNLALRGPSRAHPFGTDRLGRDQLSRVIYAARTTTVITIITAVTGGLIIGPALGLLAGYYGGWLDSLINRAGETVSSVPDLLIVILLAATIGPRLNDWVANYYGLPLIGGLLKEGYASMFVLYVVLTLVSWVGGMRLIRALTLSVRSTDYVLAARAAGASTVRILWHHILPNVMFIIILGVAATFGAVALSEIGLSFLGLGVRPPTPSFGTMILDGFNARTFNNYPWLLLFPAAFAVLLLLAFNLLGDALNDVFNPHTRNE
ncbi:MAG TPA: ABC transporter permease [Dehalococcoidia bacterium]|nr:ABC transporter permease [Dehalococcoidia bacterium]